MSLEHAYSLLAETNHNLFIHGAGGTGKTYLIKQFLHGKGLSTASGHTRIATPAGLAAANYEEEGGFTIHSLFQVSVHPLKPIIFSWKNWQQQIENKQKDSPLCSLQCLILDEISMVRSDLFQYMNDCLQHVKNNKLFFGGVRLILIGDLYQLPPVVVTNANIDDRIKLKEANCSSEWFFDAPCMKNNKNFVLCELTKNMRQQEDPEYANWLALIRTNTLPANELNELNHRLSKPSQGKPIFIYSTNQDRNTRNQLELNLLGNPIHTFNTTYLVPTTNDTMSNNLTETDQLNTREFVSSTQLPNHLHLIQPAAYPSQLKIALGARVIILCNDKKQGFYNGLTATVANIGGNYLSLLKDNDEIIDVTPRTESVWVYNVKTEACEEIFLTQFPLTLAFALTAHKTQGLTLHNTRIIIQKWWLPGMSYVALSRNPYLLTTTSATPLTSRKLFTSKGGAKFLRTLK